MERDQPMEAVMFEPEAWDTKIEPIRSQVRRRANISTSVKGVKSYDCTIETTDGTLEETLAALDELVAELDKRCPPPQE
mgnify:CR=1 FL=1|jgi:hypothetical protein